MDRSAAITTAKRYLPITVGAIVLITALIYFFTYTFYLISSDQKDLSVTVIKDGKTSNAAKLFSLYLIPKGTSTLKIEPSDESTKPKSEFIKGMADDDLGLGVRTLEVSFAPQYDLMTNGEEFDSCTTGDYPRVYNYTCGGSASVTVLNAADPTDVGTYITLPPQPIDVYAGTKATNPERQLAAEPYQKGLLLLITDEVASGSGMMYENARLKYLDETGAMTDITLSRPLETAENGRYRLLTDGNGSQQFAIIDFKDHFIDLYNKPGSKPKTIKPSQAFVGIGSALLCDLNGKILLCYSGAAGDYADSEGEAEALDKARDGFIEAFDTSSGEKKIGFTVPKDKAIESVCVDKNERIYTLDDDTIEYISEHRGAIKRQPLIKGATRLDCGNTTYFVTDNRIYAIRDDHELSADLVFASDTIDISNVHPSSSSMFLSGTFRSHPGRTLSFTATPKKDVWQQGRVADAISQLMDKHSSLRVDVRFTPQSVDFILPAHLKPGDPKVTQLLNDAKKSDAIPFTPKVHTIFEE